MSFGVRGTLLRDQKGLSVTGQRAHNWVLGRVFGWILLKIWGSLTSAILSPVETSGNIFLANMKSVLTTALAWKRKLNEWISNAQGHVEHFLPTFSRERDSALSLEIFFPLLLTIPLLYCSPRQILLEFLWTPFICFASLQCKFYFFRMYPNFWPNSIEPRIKTIYLGYILSVQQV